MYVIGVSPSAQNCTKGYACVKVNTNWSQCKPKPVPRGQVAFWHQCGGANYKKSKVCAAGSTCKVINKYYSQCRPDVPLE